MIHNTGFRYLFHKITLHKSFLCIAHGRSRSLATQRLPAGCIGRARVRAGAFSRGAGLDGAALWRLLLPLGAAFEYAPSRYCVSPYGSSILRGEVKGELARRAHPVTLPL